VEVSHASPAWDHSRPAPVADGGAYLYDSHNTLAGANAPASVQRPMVNWDVVGTKWEQLTQRARVEWTRVAG
jgi:hypothetical protein